MALIRLTPEQAVAIGRLAEPFAGYGAEDFALHYHVLTNALRLTTGDVVREIHEDGTTLLVEAVEPA